jgi:hypothetical protein
MELLPPMEVQAITIPMEQATAVGIFKYRK